MVIDWASTAVYNTLMAVAAGAALLTIAKFFKDLSLKKIESLEGYAMSFMMLGIILFVTGTHMTLTWPLSKMGFAFDDIIFGEPSLAFGILLISFSVLLFRRSNFYNHNTVEYHVSERLEEDLPKMLSPFKYFIGAMGGALIAIGIAGVTYQLFAAPPEEPISGLAADYPWLEAAFISGLYALTGVGAIATNFFIKDRFVWDKFKVFNIALKVSGWIFLAFGVMNYFTHIGLIVNTMG